MDDATVFHVYADAPRTHFIGTPINARIFFFGSAPFPTNPPIDLNLLERDQSDFVYVLIDTKSIGTLTVVAYVKLGSYLHSATTNFVPLKSDLYSRAEGLLESAQLAAKRVAIIGLGSGGSSVAFALAQSGVGTLVLVDRDRLEISNISRHICGIGDTGRLKTLAVRDVLLGKNPFLQIFTHDMDVLSDYTRLRDATEGCDLLIGATDSDQSKFQINQLALDLDVTAIFGRALTRAAGGDVLRVRPHRGPCLACVYTERFISMRQREFSNVKEVNQALPAYTSNPEAFIQVGLASDIAPISNMIVKLALTELSRGHASAALSTLDDDFRADFYMWANRREQNYKFWAPMGFTFNQPSILRWYGGDIPRRRGCLVCGLSRTLSPVEEDFFSGEQGVSK